MKYSNLNKRNTVVQLTLKNKQQWESTNAN